MKFKFIKHYLEVFSVNKKLVIAVLIAAGGLVALQGYINTAQLECLGVADSKETTIAFETAVVVKRIFVLPGQKVSKGQPLLEVEPAELTLQMLEVKTELESLESELKFRESLMSSFSSKRKSTTDDESPLARQVAGYRSQLEELKRLQGLSVRFAEEDGTVATVTYAVNEQVPPFQPIITLSSSVPNLVYGFIHEDRVSDFEVGDRIQVETLSEPKRAAQGKVISLGSRITLFPERLQTAFGTLYWGRELIVALPSNNSFFMGEKVRVHSRSSSPFSEFSSLAFADTDANTKPFLEGLDFEAGGLVYSKEDGQILVVSDDVGPSGSPFWLLNLDSNGTIENLVMESPYEIEDVESLSFSEGYYYAMSSMSESSKGKKKDDVAKRSRMIRFTVEGGKVIVDRSLEIRTALLNSLQQTPLLQAVRGDLDSLEVESLSIDGNDAFLALKEPQLKDGSSFIIHIKGIIEQIEDENAENFDISVHSLVWLKDPRCKKASRITDLLKTPNGLIIVGNCSKKEATSQIWWLPTGIPAHQVQLLKTITRARLEGLAMGAEKGEFFLSSDNGNQDGSDFFKIKIDEDF